ncbi:MAG: DUF433 domain-containing protein [Acidobacteriota bacterium]|nr:DUF433 domain-containing protein [Acidobacteriota bacterium]
MEAIMEHLTTTEAAVAAGVSLPQVNRVIDEKILPDDWYSTSPTRTVRRDACLLISFYFETADWLTASARLQTIRNAVAHGHTWEQWKNYAVDDHFLTVRFADLWKSVDGRLRKLIVAEKMVVEDPEIMGGTPVIRGTRIPVHIVAALFDAGTPMERILKSYPSLTGLQVELASIYAKAVPQRGRPKRREYPAGTKVLSVKRGNLKARVAG